MKQVQEWLAAGGQDYARGVALYEAHGTSRVVLTTLRRGESEFTRQKLRQVLTQLVAAAPAPAAAPVAAPVPRQKPARAATPTSVAAPAPDEARRQQRSSWYAERHRLHAQLELVPTDEERRTMGERILQLSEWLTASYQAPVAPASPAAGPDLASLTDQGEVRRRLGNLRALASKLKHNPARTLDLQQVRADINLLESKLVKS